MQSGTLQCMFNPEQTNTKHGILLLPDVSGHGPMFVSVLEKRLDGATSTRLQLQSLKVAQQDTGAGDEDDEGGEALDDGN